MSLPVRGSESRCVLVHASIAAGSSPPPPAGFPQFTDDFIAGLGAALNPDSISAPGTGHVFAKADTLSSPRRFIVTWDDVYTYGTTDRQNFEIVLYENPTGEDGRILVQYRDVPNPPPHP